MNAPRTRLPVFVIWMHAWGLIRTNRLKLVRAGVAPLLLLTTAFALYYQMFQTITPQDKSFSDVISRLPPLRILTTWLTGFLGMLTLLSLNVTWRRFLLGLPQAIDCAWFRKPFWKYGLSVFLGWLAFICLLSIGGSLFIKLLQPVTGTAILLLAVALALVTGLAWHLPLFTEMLTDDSNIDLSLYRSALKGDVWRIMAIWLLAYGPIILTEDIAATLLGKLAMPAAQAVIGTLGAGLLAVATILCVLVGSAISAIIYDSSVRNKEIRP